MSIDQRGLSALKAVGRTRLARLPTALERADRLRDALGAGGPSLWLKRDDETGFALGGNKVRKLEAELAPENLNGVTHLVTSGGPQSNHARVTAAAAAFLGLKCVLVLNGPVPRRPSGNALLQRMFGATVRSVDSREERVGVMAEAAREIDSAGGRALEIALGASTPRGALGYALAAVELDGQMPRSAQVADGRTWIIVASSSCGTIAGLSAGFAVLGRSDVGLVGVSADISSDEVLATTRALSSGALALLGGGTLDSDIALDADDGQVGEGYGIPTAASREAIDLFATTQGVLLDPVYTAKAAAALVARVRAGTFSARDRVVFWHTGGHPALFAGQASSETGAIREQLA